MGVFRIISLTSRCVTLNRDWIRWWYIVSAGAQLGDQDLWDVALKGANGPDRGGFWTSHFETLTKLEQMFEGATYLFTFCPPAPDALEKVVREIDSGIVFLLKFENHLRAASRSASFASTDWDAYPRRFCVNLNCSERGFQQRDLRAWLRSMVVVRSVISDRQLSGYLITEYSWLLSVARSEGQNANASTKAEKLKDSTVFSFAAAPQDFKLSSVSRVSLPWSTGNPAVKERLRCPMYKLFAPVLLDCHWPAQRHCLNLCHWVVNRPRQTHLKVDFKVVA